MREFDSPAELAKEVGNTFGPGEWLKITQKMIDDFAEATGDRQWIHVDVERAAREAPGGKTIAHGYLTLALMGRLQPSIYTVKARQILNYGINKLRFLSAIPVDSRIRLKATIQSAEEASGGLRIAAQSVFELEGSDKPAMIAEIVFLYYG